MTYDSNLQSYDEYITNTISNQTNSCVTTSSGIQYNYYGNSVTAPSTIPQYNAFDNSQPSYYASTVYEVNVKLSELIKWNEYLEERYNSLLGKCYVLEDKCRDLDNRCKDLEEFKKRVVEGTPVTKLDKEDTVFESLFDAVVSLDTRD